MIRSLALSGLASLLVCSCDRTCTLEDELKKATAVGGVDCGHVAVGADRAATDMCIFDALNGGTSFRAIYEQQGTDSHVATGVARAADGSVTFLQYDGNPSGGGGDSHPVVDKVVCRDPTFSAALVAGAGNAPPIACGSFQRAGTVCQ